MHFCEPYSVCNYLKIPDRGPLLSWRTVCNVRHLYSLPVLIWRISQINPDTWSEAWPYVRAALSLGVTHSSFVTLCMIYGLREGVPQDWLGKGHCYPASNGLHTWQDKPGHMLSLCSTTSPLRIHNQSTCERKGSARTAQYTNPQTQQRKKKLTYAAFYTNNAVLKRWVYTNIWSAGSMILCIMYKQLKT